MSKPVTTGAASGASNNGTTQVSPVPEEVIRRGAASAASDHRRWARARAAAAVLAGRTAGALARRLRMGAGTSLPGLVAQRIFPGVTAYLGAQLRHGSVVITGTNGKTTTSGMTAYALRAGGLRVWRNREGANLLRGVTAALVIRARLHGNLRRQGNAAAVFEVDEAAFPHVVAALQPRVVAITNLFRDQLDRYGEVDTVAERWRSALSALPDGTTTLVLNADDPSVAALGEGFAGRVIYFGVESVGADKETSETAEVERVEVMDARSCPRCHADLTFAPRYYSHIGHWACPACGYKRPATAVSASEVQSNGLAASRFRLALVGEEHGVEVALPGLYNVYNALAATAVGLVMGVQGASVVAALRRFTPAFGRAERIEVDGRMVHLLLAKNPTGLNEVLRALSTQVGVDHLLLALNDLAADGEDVSWIWDADLERLAERNARVTASGTRAYDLALRLKYANVPDVMIEPELAHALWRSVDETPAGKALHVVPTYTAMLEIRGELERRGYAPRYWEQRDT